MYEINEVWKEFYEELDPEIRTELYKEITGSVEDDGANNFRRSLLQKRYENPKDPEHRYPFDLFLQQCVVLPVAYKRRKVLFTNVKKQAIISSVALCLDQELNDIEKASLYWELRNAAKRYFATCSSDSYARSMFGMKVATSEEKRKRMLEEAWRMSKGISEVSGLQKEYELFVQAVQDELEPRGRGSWLKSQ